VTSTDRWTRIAERGSAGALRLAVWFHRTFGRAPMRVVLWGIALYFWLFHAEAVRGSQDYLATLWSTPEGRRTLGPRPRRLTSLRHIHSFAVALYDRVVVWGGETSGFEADHDGSGRLFELAAAGRGALLLGAHLGSYEMLWSISREYDLRVNVVVFYDNAERINSFLHELNPNIRIRAIGLDPTSVKAAFAIKACIDRGEFVVMLADRIPPQPGRTTETNFLGRRARFPESPFLLTGLLGCPAYLALCVRTGDTSYRTILRELWDGTRVPRAERSKHSMEVLERYVGYLEQYCCEQPFEWFNFYRFWEP